MKRATKFGTVLVSTMAIAGGLTIGAAPAMATCAPTISVGADSVTACAVAGTYDTHPGSAGEGVQAAASVEIVASGDTIICTGYNGAEVNIPQGPEVEILNGANASPCTPL
jgi:hypothetical protein